MQKVFWKAKMQEGSKRKEEVKLRKSNENNWN